jgi:4-hydroxybenzoate polyprenyltransferase
VRRSLNDFSRAINKNKSAARMVLRQAITTIGIYTTPGIFLLIASCDQFQYRSLIWFTVWSSIVHSGIMAVQAILNSERTGHLYGDVLRLVLVAGVLVWLMTRK